jgi:DNA gyrase subunit B
MGAMSPNDAPDEPRKGDPAPIQPRPMADFIRRRPLMHTGARGAAGLHNLAHELIEYALAESSCGQSTTLHVRFHRDGSLAVADDGRGIPMATHAETGTTTLEWVMTHGTGFEVVNGERVFRTSLHGVGTRAVTALSDWSEAEVCHGGRVYRQRYERGLPTGDVCDAGPAGPRTGTRITFHPDHEIFGDADFDHDRLADRLRELAFLNKGLAFRLTDERGGKDETFKYDGGIREFVEYLNRSQDVLHAPLYVDETIHPVGADDTEGPLRVEVALQYTTGTEERVRCYTNNAHNPVGGTYLSGFRAAVARTVNAYGKRQGLFKDGQTPTGGDIREGMTAVVRVQVPDPQFESNNKLRLNTPEVEGAVFRVISEFLGRWLEENPRAARKIVLKVAAAGVARRTGTD